MSRDVKKIIISKDVIDKIYDYDKNAFLLGCGRDTMMYKFYEVTGILFSKSDIRNSLKYHYIEIKQRQHCTRFIPPKN